jgi:hypothetical protein
MRESLTDPAESPLSAHARIFTDPIPHPEEILLSIRDCAPGMCSTDTVAEEPFDRSPEK